MSQGQHQSLAYILEHRMNGFCDTCTTLKAKWYVQIYGDNPWVTCARPLWRHVNYNSSVF